MSVVTPTPFGLARAVAIWEQRGWQHSVEHAMTPGELAYVAAVWMGMPGWTCWMDAFFDILNGRVAP